ncbi:MAG: tryptophan synthase subunit alpha [Verrucomicrobiales bacterium]
MSTRISSTFQRLKEADQKGFVAYITAGDPTLEATVALALSLEKAGVDILELGVPFSDPLADGLVNQLAAQRALEAGASLIGVLKAVQEIRKTSELPLVLFTYLNPVYQYGYEKFFNDASEAGVDGVLFLDLPPEESLANHEFTGTGLDLIRLIAPTTSASRMDAIAQTGTGFIYYVSREGVTGEQAELSTSIAGQIEKLRAATSLPIAIGFGISTPEQAMEAAQFADAVVVGSAIVRRVGEWGQEPDLAKKVQDFVAPMTAAVHGR